LSRRSQSLEERVIGDTRRWLERAVIGLNLCPFAKSVHVHQRIHYAVSRAGSASELLECLTRELEGLQQHPATVRETTLLMAPCCMQEFLAFNDFLKQAERRLARSGLQGIIQLASFHPQYQFADAAADAIGNFTNRSPYPTVHLLRESSIDRAVQMFPEPGQIFEANMRTLERLGAAGWTALGVGPSA
jgi:hypothetical protein